MVGMNSWVLKIGRLPFLLRFIALVVFSFVVFYFRNSDAFQHPILYAEDGYWIARALNGGWIEVFINARPDYFVWGNLLLMFLSVQTSLAFSGNALLWLPEAVAFYSLLFFSLVGTACFFLTEKLLSCAARCILFFLILLLPLGDTSSEIIGRLNNIGYAFYFLSVLLLIGRGTLLLTRFKVRLIDLALLLCVATNPICFFAVVSYLLVFEYKASDAKLFLLKNKFLLTGLLVLAAFIFFRYAQNGLLTSRGKNASNFVVENLLEVLVARSILYPFVFPYYSAFNDYWVIGIFVLFVGLVIFALIFAGNSFSRKILLLLFFWAVLASAATAFMRPVLTELLNHYSSSYPDRYFYGTNYIAVFVAVLAVDLINNKGRLRWLCAALTVFTLGLYLTNLTFLFEGRSPRTLLMTDLSFREQVFSVSNSSGQKWHRDFGYAFPSGDLPTGEMLEGKTYTQLIPLLSNHVSSIEIQFATYRRLNSGSVLVELFSPSEELLHREYIDVSTLVDYGYFKINLKKELNFKELDVKLKLTPVKAKPSNAVALVTLDREKNFDNKAAAIFQEQHVTSKRLYPEQYVPTDSLFPELKTGKYDLHVDAERLVGRFLSYRVNVAHNEEVFYPDYLVRMPIYPRSWSVNIPFKYFPSVDVSQFSGASLAAGANMKVLSELVGMSRYSGVGSTKSGEFIKGSIYEQNIPIAFNRLSGLSLQLGTYGRKNTGLMYVEIKDAKGRYVHNESVQLSRVPDSEYFYFRFKQDWIAMKGVDVVVSLSFPDSVPGNAITVLFTKNMFGQAYDATINAEPVLGYSFDYRTFVD